MPNKGLLLVVSDPPAEFEEEFNAWYDTEHVPERLGIPGFESGLRYVSADRPRRYLALYDLASVAVLDTPAYLARAGVNFTPWSKRVVARCRIDRVAAVQAFPGEHLTVPGARLLHMRLTGSAAAAERFVRGCLAGRPAVQQIRGFADTASARLDVLVSGAGDLAALVEPAAAQEAGVALVGIETYLPY